MILRGAPIIHARTFHVDFRSKLLIRPNFFSEVDAELIAYINNLNFQNSETINNIPTIYIMVGENSQKVIITFIPIVKIKTIGNPLTAETVIFASMKIASGLNKLSIISDYFDNSLVDK